MSDASHNITAQTVLQALVRLSESADDFERCERLAKFNEYCAIVGRDGDINEPVLNEAAGVCKLCVVVLVFVYAYIYLVCGVHMRVFVRAVFVLNRVRVWRGA